MKSFQDEDLKAFLSFLFVCLIWGLGSLGELHTYMEVREVISTAPKELQVSGICAILSTSFEITCKRVGRVFRNKTNKTFYFVLQDCSTLLVNQIP